MNRKKSLTPTKLEKNLQKTAESCGNLKFLTTFAKSLKIKEAKLSDLVFDDKNFNKHTEYGMSLIEKSIRNNGAGRSILIDKNNRIIAGNGVTEIAGQIGLDDVQIVETDGTKIIAVKRTDIDLDSKQGREMALADNATGAADLQWDYDQLRQELDEKIMKDYGIKMPELKSTEILSAIEYNSCYYEPTEQPNINLEDCINFDKFNAKVKALDEFKLSDDERKVLMWFCYRFLKIDFESVANYYAFNASEEMKKAMERLRLVLVDGGVDGFIEDELLRIINTEMELQDADD